MPRGKALLLAALAAVAVGAVAVVLLIGGGDGGAPSAEEKRAAASSCRDEQAAPVTWPPSTGRYRPLSRNQARGIDQLFANTDVPANLVVGRRVTVSTGQGTGVVVVNKTAG